MRKPAIVYTSLRRSNAERFEALIAAQRAGLSVVLMGEAIPEMAKPYAAECHICDISDQIASMEYIRNIALRYDILGAISWTDLGLECAAHINENLSLPGLSVKLLQTLKNKHTTRQTLAHIEGICPKFALVSNLTELKAAMRTIAYPAIVKPVGGNGSKGIFTLHNASQLENAMTELHRLINNGSDAIFKKHGDAFIVEEFIFGDEVSLEVMIHNHHIDLIGVTDKKTADPFHFELQHIFPAQLSKNAYADITEKIVKIITTLGCNDCTLHIEGKINNDKFTLIEINARPGGDYITTHLIPRSTGADHMANIIKVATGSAPDISAKKHICIRE